MKTKINHAYIIFTYYGTSYIKGTNFSDTEYLLRDRLQELLWLAELNLSIYEDNQKPTPKGIIDNPELVEHKKSYKKTDEDDGIKVVINTDGVITTLERTFKDVEDVELYKNAYDTFLPILGQIADGWDGTDEGDLVRFKEVLNG